MEGDAINIVTGIYNRVQGSSPFHLVYDCCFDVLSYFDFSMFSYVHRAGNIVAHMVAKWTTDINSKKVCMPPFPECLWTLEMLNLR